MSKFDYYFGDCLEKMDAIPSGSIHTIIADLPFGTTQCEWDSIIPLPELWSEYKRLLKPNGVVILHAQSPFDKVLGCSNLPWLRYEWIWEKTSATGHYNAKKMPMKAHENVLVFYDRLPTYNPQKTFGHKRKSAHKRVTLNSPVYNPNTSAVTYNSTERYPRSVQVFASDKQKSNLHPTQKPLKLVEYLVKTYTNDGDVVLDNCMGSGTTGVACANLNRNFIGIEMDGGYFADAVTRIEKARATTYPSQPEIPHTLNSTQSSSTFL